jgi:hypothetical protein
VIRIARFLAIAAALMFAQQAAVLHAFSHLAHDLAAAQGDKPVPPLGHSVEQCLALHAVDSTLPAGAIALDSPRAELLEPGFVSLPIARSPRIEFDSRAPPALSS